ncbi:hypothetical protein OH799_10590 [Nocardia sp. NBC_00881]|uniref:hypothetical protein n=1 Tax=Nocardia sp. NBC_00881 TaxID=2975995 RepID=UPI00386A2E40|nr:hypothetical protein OH799_10590 [Nocardia sp. NBC_00881]
MTERSEGAINPTVGDDTAERQRGGVVTERSEGAINTAPTGTTQPSASKAES